MRITFKKILLLILFAIISVLAFNYKLIGYGIAQAKGQVQILLNVQTVEEALADPLFPDSLKASLTLVQEIKVFAIEELGLRPTKNYSTVYDQQGKEILWVVTACDPYKFEPLMWSFPIIGSFTYKGFFEYEKSIDLAKSLKAEGYDVELRSVSGWSTLGWFKDPILSNMLAKEPGELASTIIHELTHGTIFIPDSMTFNENLATFIGNRGALEFLKNRFGEDSEEFINYQIRKSDVSLFTRHIVRGALELDSLYNSIENESEQAKLKRKALFINKIISSKDTLALQDSARYKNYFNLYAPNNAYFISFLNYRERQDEFDQLLTDSLENDLSLFVNHWQVNYRK